MSAADEKESRQSKLVFNEAWNRHDPDGMVAFLAEDAQFITVNGVWMKSRAGSMARARREPGQRNRAAAGKHARDTRDRHPFPRTDVAMVHSHFRISGDIGDDGKPDRRDGCGIEGGAQAGRPLVHGRRPEHGCPPPQDMTSGA